MAASVHADYVDQLLKRVYTDEVLDWFYNNNAELLAKLDTLKLIPLETGDGFYWPFKFQSPWNVGAPSESGNVPIAKAATAPQGRVRNAWVVGNIELSYLLAAVGKGEGAWKSVVKDEMGAAINNMTKLLNMYFAGTHGTGRLGQVEAATSSSTSFVGKLPIGTLLFRPKMRIQIADSDTGSGGSEDDNEVIQKVVQTTRTVTLENAQTLDADDHVYLSGSYGSDMTPNGLLGLIDDGTYVTTLHNVSRSTYEEMKAVVSSNSGVLRDLSEDLLIRNTLDVYQKSGQWITDLWMNTGQLEKFAAFMRPDRRISGGTGAGDDYTAGFKGAKFVLGAHTVEVNFSSDITPRTVYGVHKPSLRRVGEKRPKWLEGYQGEGSYFVQGADSNGRTMTQAATAVCFSNVANLRPDAHFRIDDLSDPQLCGARVGGTDA
jgi:hypothetical protein